MSKHSGGQNPLCAYSGPHHPDRRAKKECNGRFIVVGFSLFSVLAVPLLPILESAAAVVSNIPA